MYDEFQTQQFWDNMKKSQLKQLIKEEFNKILNEENTKVSFEDIDYYVGIETQKGTIGFPSNNFEEIKDVVLDTIKNRVGNLNIKSMSELVKFVAKNVATTGGKESEAKEYITKVVNQDQNMVNLILEPQIGDIVPYEKREWEIIDTSEKGGSKQFRLQSGSDKTWVTADMIKRSKNNQ